MTYVMPPSVRKKTARVLMFEAWHVMPFRDNSRYYSTTFALREASGELKFSSQEDRVVKLVMYRFIDHLVKMSIVAEWGKDAA